MSLGSQLLIGKLFLHQPENHVCPASSSNISLRRPPCVCGKIVPRQTLFLLQLFEQPFLLFHVSLIGWASKFRRSPTITGHCAQNPVHAEESTAVQQELQNNTGAENADTPLPRATLLHQREGAHAPPNPSPESTHPNRAMRDRAWQKVARVSLKLSPQPSRLAAPRRRRGPPLTWPRRFAVRHSLEYLHAQLRRVPRQSRRSFRLTHMLYHPHLMQTMALPWWKILCSSWTLITPKRGCKALFCTSSPLPKTACHTSFWRSSSSYLVSASSWSKIVCSAVGRGLVAEAAAG